MLRHVANFGTLLAIERHRRNTMINAIKRILGISNVVPAETIYHYTVNDGDKVVVGCGTRSQCLERARQYGWWGITLKCEALGINI